MMFRKFLIYVVTIEIFISDVLMVYSNTKVYGINEHMVNVVTFFIVISLKH